MATPENGKSQTKISPSEKVMQLFQQYPKLYQFMVRLGLWGRPLIVERQIVQAFLTQLFGPVEAKRWLDYIEKEKRKVYGKRNGK